MSQFLYTDSHSTPSLYHSLHSWSCHNVYCDYTKVLDSFLFFKYIIDRLPSKCTVSFCKPTLTFWELLTAPTKEIYKNMYCTVLCIQLVMCKVGKGPAGEILHSAEREMLWCKYEWLARLSTSKTDTNCDIYIYIYIYIYIASTTRRTLCFYYKDPPMNAVWEIHAVYCNSNSVL
jgi:hypothetical protein